MMSLRAFIGFALCLPHVCCALYASDIIDIYKDAPELRTIRLRFDPDVTTPLPQAFRKSVRKYVALTGIFAFHTSSRPPDVTLTFKHSLFGGLAAQAENNLGETIMARRLNANLSEKALDEALLDTIDRLTYAVTGARSVLRTVFVYVEQTPDQESKLVLANLIGSQRKVLIRSKAVLAFPAWSPDGQSFLFSKTDRNGGRILLYDMKTGKQRKVAHFKNSTAVGGSWEPNQQSIIAAITNKGSSKLYRLSSKRPNTILDTLTPGKGGLYSDVNVSPRGNLTLFSAYKAGAGVVIYRMDMKTHLSTLLPMPGSYNVEPRWSPLGDVIVYSGMTGDTFQLFLTDAAGQPLRRLTNHGGSSEQAGWSFDGKQVLYTYQTRSVKKIFVIPITGNKRRRLTSTPVSVRESHPAWNPLIAPDFFATPEK